MLRIEETETSEKPKLFEEKLPFLCSKNVKSCTQCNSIHTTLGDFRDQDSRREHKASGMCQVCQDELFGIPGTL